MGMPPRVGLWRVVRAACERILVVVVVVVVWGGKGLLKHARGLLGHVRGLLKQHMRVVIHGVLE